MKTNHKISFLYLALNVLCGLVLAVHRAFSTATGVQLFLVALAAAFVVSLGALGAEKLRKKLQLKPAAMDKVGYAMLVGAGFLFLLSAGFTLLQHDMSTLLRLVCALFAAGCGAVTLMRVALRDSGEKAAVYSLVPIFYLSIYLLLFYRSNGDNPALHRFGYEIAVILVVLLGVYASVAGKFEQPRPRFRVVCCGAGLLMIVQELAFALLAPGLVFSIPGFSPSTVTMLAAFALLLLCSLCFPPVREVFPIVEEEKGESEDPAEE